VTNSPRLPIVSLILAGFLAIAAAVTIDPAEPIPLSELQLGAIGGAVTLAVFGIQGFIPVLLEGLAYVDSLRLSLAESNQVLQGVVRGTIADEPVPVTDDLRGQDEA
jgi:hypothetical protein